MYKTAVYTLVRPNGVITYQKPQI